MKFQAPKGTRDFYPADMAVRKWIVDAWRRVSIRHGFEEYDGPIFEQLDLYRVKSGEGIVSELFHFKDRGDRELAIRPEMTPTMARMIAARANSLPRPIKWFSVPRLCRAERPQRGRLREFFQWNIDIVGVDDVLADAECIFVMCDFLREVGLGPEQAIMKINSRSLLSALLTAQGFASERHIEIFALLDKRDKLPPDVFAEQLAKIGTPAEVATLQTIGQAKGPEGLEQIAEMTRGNQAAQGELTRLSELFRHLTIMGVGDLCTYDMGVVRGLAYYTGVVFEGFGKGGLQRAICGGGRYDQLLEVLGGPPMSGVGFGTSDVVILDLLNDVQRLPAHVSASKQLDFFVIDADAALFINAVTLVAQLRRQGFAAEFSYRRQGIGKQLEQANNARSKRAVILGGEFTDRGAVVVKDLSTRNQVEIPLDRFLANPTAWPETAEAASR
jgi:histidyl-tRNA synthetase